MIKKELTDFRKNRSSSLLFLQFNLMFCNGCRRKHGEKPFSGIPRTRENLLPLAPETRKPNYFVRGFSLILSGAFGSPVKTRTVKNFVVIALSRRQGTYMRTDAFFQVFLKK